MPGLNGSNLWRTSNSLISHLLITNLTFLDWKNYEELEYPWNTVGIQLEFAIAQDL